MDIKQVIVMRKDLRNLKGEKVRTGKLIGQGAHASMAIFFKLIDPDKEGPIKETFNDCEYIIKIPHDMDIWRKDIFTKVVLAVNSNEELLDIYNKANEANLPTVLITDSGQTEFLGPTNTCIAIGPAKIDKINPITSHLSTF